MATCSCRNTARKMAKCELVCILLGLIIGTSLAKPITVSRVIRTGIDDIKSMIKNTKLLPPDHMEGVKLERDGDINKDFHHEAFLGKHIKDGTLSFENKMGYQKLIEIFHKVDYDKDHLVSKEELAWWIHERILDHVEDARKRNAGLFKSADLDKNKKVTWLEYRTKLLMGDKNGTVSQSALHGHGEDGGLPDEYAHWKKADVNHDNQMDETEFLYFQHPEYNPQTIMGMAEDMMVNFDRNSDKIMTEAEFIALPPGDVDPDQAASEKEYKDDRMREYKQMDKNSDGVVKLDELALYLDPRHQQHATNEAAYLISVADKNRDGKLSELEMLRNYQLFTGSSLANFAGVLHDEF